MISVRQAVSSLELEDIYAEIGSVDGSVLRVPTSLKYGGAFGVPASLIQFMATWSRKQTNAKLKLYPSGETPAALQGLAQEPHGMAALYFAPSMVDKTNHVVPSRDGLTYVIPHIHAMQNGDYLGTMHGRGVFLGCFAGAKNEYLHPLYSRGQQNSLRGRDDFAILARQIIEACAPSARRGLTPRRLNAISNLMYELFRNTDEHARTDEIGKFYSRNLRGLMVKFISVNAEAVKSESSGRDVPHSIFILRNLANQRLHLNAEGRPRSASDASYLELTVFDTGPGLVRRWMSKNGEAQTIDKLRIEEEVDLVRTCFERHTTTKDIEASGHGLDLVVNVLSELKAFLRLRTGRLCLIQDFSSLKSKKFEPQHWLKDRIELPLTAGAAYSIIIPLSRTE